MGELEQAVMAVLWELDDEQWATVRQVHESLADRALAYTTVMTVMDRLARKELRRAASARGAPTATGRGSVGPG